MSQDSVHKPQHFRKESQNKLELKSVCVPDQLLPTESMKCYGPST